MVTEALCYLSISILPYVFRDSITRIYYSFNDSRTPFIVATCSILLKYILNVVLITKLDMGIAGITLSTSFITLFNAVLLGIFVSKKIKLEYASLFKNLGKMLIAGALTFVICIFLSKWMAVIPLPKYIFEAVKIIVVGLVCFGAYTVFNLIFKMEYAKELYARVSAKFLKH